MSRDGEYQRTGKEGGPRSSAQSLGRRDSGRKEQSAELASAWGSRRKMRK